MSSGARDELPESAVLASLGCGNPIAIAELHEGETVLDLGSGGGIDVLLSARRVGPSGLAYGLDMTDEMLDLARRNQAEAGVTNVQWLRGHIEEIPLPRDSVDVIISNCVINLSGDKPQVLREAARVLKPGGRFAVSDVVADDGMDDATRADMQAYTGCIAGALTRDEFTQALSAAGLTEITITETHRVHPAAISAIVRATKPGGGTHARDRREHGRRGRVVLLDHRARHLLRDLGKSGVLLARDHHKRRLRLQVDSTAPDRRRAHAGPPTIVMPPRTEPPPPRVPVVALGWSVIISAHGGAPLLVWRPHDPIRAPLLAKLRARDLPSRCS